MSEVALAQRLLGPVLPSLSNYRQRKMKPPKVSWHISNISMGIKSRSAALSLYQLFSLKLLYSLSLWGARQELSDCIWFLNGLPALASLPPVDHRLPKARVLGGALSFPVAILLVESLASMEVSGRDGCAETD